MNEEGVEPDVVQKVPNVGRFINEIARWKRLECLPGVNGEAPVVSPIDERRIAENEGKGTG